MKTRILVSIIIPTRNEEKYLGKTIDSLLGQDYSKENLEILFVDGMSTDKTREIISKYSQQHNFIKILENPNIFTPYAFNLGIKNAKGDVIITMGAHTTYSANYISTIVKNLSEGQADCVGSVAQTLPGDNSAMAKAIALALSSPFGVGNSYMRTGSKNSRYVDAASCPAFKKEVFDRIGLFDEKLVHSQDMEFNLRLKKAGGKILLNPDITSYYYARPNYKSFCQHNFRNGKWAVLPFKYATGMPLSWRHMVPLVFVASLLVSGGGSVLLGLADLPGLTPISRIFSWIFIFISCSYLIANLYFSIRISYREKKSGYFFIIPFTFATLHIAYGLGSIWGAMKLIFSKQSWKNLIRNLKN